MFLFIRKIYFGVLRRWRRFYYRHLLGSMGKGCSVCANVLVTNAEDVHLGECVTVNDRVVLQACEGAEIHLSDGGVVSFNAMLITGGLELGEHGVIRESHESSTICIGKRAWIGAGAIILPGVTIGESAVIAAGSVVTRDIPANCLAAGVPAKVVRNVG